MDLRSASQSNDINLSCVEAKVKDILTRRAKRREEGPVQRAGCVSSIDVMPTAVQYLVKRCFCFILQTLRPCFIGEGMP
jgi:hypothetical protein